MRELDAPGSGLPPVENFFLNLIFKTGCVAISDRRALKLFAEHGQILLDLYDDVDIHEASQPVLIPRLAGMEDSSRHWSLLMIFDHLNQVNKAILDVIEELKHNIEPRLETRIADFKPAQDCDLSVVDEFLEINQTYLKRIAEWSPLKSRMRHQHPWFGRLDAHGWHCLAAVHMRIHAKQAHKIRTMQGVA